MNLNRACLYAFVALAMLTIALAEDEVPREARSHYEAGIAAKKAGDLESATKELDAAVEFAPGWVDAHYALAWTYAGRKNKQAAVDEFNWVIYLAPDSEHGSEAKAAIERLGGRVTPPEAPGKLAPANREETAGDTRLQWALKPGEALRYRIRADYQLASPVAAPGGEEWTMKLDMIYTERVLEPDAGAPIRVEIMATSGSHSGPMGPPETVGPSSPPVIVAMEGRGRLLSVDGLFDANRAGGGWAGGIAGSNFLPLHQCLVALGGFPNGDPAVGESWSGNVPIIAPDLGEFEAKFTATYVGLETIGTARCAKIRSVTELPAGALAAAVQKKLGAPGTGQGTQTIDLTSLFDITTGRVLKSSGKFETDATLQPATGPIPEVAVRSHGTVEIELLGASQSAAKP